MSDGGLPAGDPYDWFVRSRDLYADGNAAAAAELLAHAVEREPQARSLREAWARALFDARRYEDAAREFRTLTEQAPDDHYAHFGAGLTLWRLQRFPAAAEHLRIAVAMRPDRTEYVNALGQVRATMAARAAADLPPEGELAGSLPSPVAPTVATGTGPVTEQTLSRTYDVALLDLDGVVYRGPDEIPRAVMCIRAAVDAGMRTAYVTNNAARPPAEVAGHLTELGLDVAAADVVTSAQAGARVLREWIGTDRPVLAVGGPGVELALRDEGLLPVRRRPDAPVTSDVAAVLIGYGPDVSWRDLADASYAIAGGAAFVATNTDLTIPTRWGIGPGNGAMVAAVRAATGVSPVVAGKPFSPLLSQTIERTGARLPLVIGDRLDTDIEAAMRLELPSLLVLTGVTDVPTLLAAAPERRPTYLAADLRGLLARGRYLRTGPAARVDSDGRLELATGYDGSDTLAGLRAAAAACWEAADRGRPAHWSAEVVEELTAAVHAELAP